MALAVRLDTMRSRVRQLANCEGASNPSDSEINSYINDAIRSFWVEVLEGGWGRGWWEKTGTITIVAGTSVYALPSDFLSLRLAEWVLTESNRVVLLPWSLQESASVRGIWRYLVRLYPQYPRYRITQNGSDGQGPAIDFQPTPRQGGTVALTYVVTPPQLSADDKTIDGVAGWDRWIVYRAVVDVKTKQGDPGLGDVVALADRELARLRAGASHRDSGSPRAVLDFGAW